MRVKITINTLASHIYIEIATYNHNSYMHLPVNNNLHNSGY